MSERPRAPRVGVSIVILHIVHIKQYKIRPQLLHTLSIKSLPRILHPWVENLAPESLLVGVNLPAYYRFALPLPWQRKTSGTLKGKLVPMLD